MRMTVILLLSLLFLISCVQGPLRSDYIVQRMPQDANYEMAVHICYMTTMRLKFISGVYNTDFDQFSGWVMDFCARLVEEEFRKQQVGGKDWT